MTATIPRVPRPRGELTEAQRRRFIRAENALDDAKDRLREVVLSIMAEGASFAEVNKLTGISTNTLQRWKREASE